MLTIENLDQLPHLPKYPVMAIGVFDGIHLGHQAVLRRLVERTREREGTSILLTFYPHPQKIISPPDAPALLLTSRQKEEILAKHNLDLMIQLPFTRELSLFTPEHFARAVLQNHGIREIHVGSNFRFGRHRRGDFQTLRSLGRELQFEVYKINQICFRNVPISSTRIRALLKSGRVSLARRLLNRPYQIRGTVLRGARKGVELGFPTANLASDNELIPANGVYASRAQVSGDCYPSVTNIGYRPTLHQVETGTPVIETHLLDFEGNLYGKALLLDFCLRLRAERKFESVERLKRQIEKDIHVTRKYMARANRSLDTREEADGNQPRGS